MIFCSCMEYIHFSKCFWQKSSCRGMCSMFSRILSNPQHLKIAWKIAQYSVKTYFWLFIFSTVFFILMFFDLLILPLTFILGCIGKKAVARTLFISSHIFVVNEKKVVIKITLYRSRKSHKNIICYLK